MTATIRLPADVLEDARQNAELSYRTIPKQIEYWYKLGKLADENPDLPMEFIKHALIGRMQIDNGETSRFEFRKS
ncbi:hypothetical protein AGMMS50229_18510 [Campylobacterota bacterium]|nr:hypothetical protein AGMMS50229_18510 [Campylobacterota bacterium]